MEHADQTTTPENTNVSVWSVLQGKIAKVPRMKNLMINDAYHLKKETELKSKMISYRYFQYSFQESDMRLCPSLPH